MIDHFKLMRLLGRGGMGEVYLARDTSLGRKVALKLIHAEGLSTDNRARERFVFEAQATATFSHPHIVTIHAVGEYQGRPYLALEYLEGETLRARLAERPSLQAALRMGLAIAEALREAHRNQILHRDLKPENVLVPRDGRLRVVDFGLAQAMLGSATTPIVDDKSDAALLRGTPGYLAPEQWRQQEVTEATDVWALGVILFELVYGRHPYPGLSVKELAATVAADAPVPKPPAGTDAPTALHELIASCLQKSPAQRAKLATIIATLEQLTALGPRRSDGEEESPFRGLLPFAEQHAEYFFGRDAEVAMFFERMREEPVLPVVGPSGAGKSSFVQAGVLPRLREDASWEVLYVRPGARPFRALAHRLVTGGEHRFISDRNGLVETGPLDAEGAAATGAESRADQEFIAAETDRVAAELAESPPRLSLALRRLADDNKLRVLLIVDQLEEVYTHVDDEAERRAFMQAVCTAADDRYDPVRVIFTLRDDFLGRLADSPEAREALSRLTVLRSPGEDALAEIITKPAALAGYSFDDPQLVTEMVSAVRGEPACLPLLAFATRMLWERRDKQQRRLSRREYEAMGGVEGALATHADGVLAGLAAADVALARAMVLRLVSASGTRQVLPRSRVVDGLGAGAPNVLVRLTQSRLISVRKARGEDRGAEAELELAHESLIHRWQTLARWIDETRGERTFLAEVGQAAKLWEARGRRGDEVWSGDALREAARALQRVRAPVPTLVAEFLDAGATIERRRVRARRITRVIGGAALGAITLISIIVALVIADKEHVAQRHSEEARRRWAEAQREGARAALMHGETIEARAKLRGSLETEDSALGRALWRSLAHDPLVWKKAVGAAVYSVAFSPDGEQVAAACQDGSIWILTVKTLGVRVLRGPDQVLAIAFSPDGKQLVTGFWNNEVGIWDLAAGSMQALQGHSSGVWAVAWSRDGKTLASGSFDRTVRVWDLRSTPINSRVLTGHTAGINAIAFSPDGARLASASWDKSARIWDVSSGVSQRTLIGHSATVVGVAFSPDGKLLASSAGDATTRVWDASSGQELAVLRGATKAVNGVTFSPDGRMLAAASDDNEIRIWNISGNKLDERAVLTGHHDRVTSVAFSPNSKQLISGGYDSTVELWDMSITPPRVQKAHTGPIVAVAFSRDGHHIASASYDHSVRVWDAATGAQQQVFRGHTHRVFAVAFGPDFIVSAGQDTTVRIWSLATGAQLHLLLGHTATIYDIAVSPDGKTIASASDDGTVRVWSGSSGALLRVLHGHRDAVNSVAFSHDGKRIASGSADYGIIVWDDNATSPSRRFEGHTATVQGVAFSPDDSQLVSSSEDGSVRTWSLSSGRNQIVGKHAGRVYQVAWDPSGHRVGSAGSDAIARIWSLDGGADLVLRGHHGEVNHLDFSPNGSSLVTAGDDGSVRLWNTSTGAPIWETRALIRDHGGVYLMSHRGWERLDDGPSAATAIPAALVNATRAAQSADGTRLCVIEGRAAQVWERGVLGKAPPIDATDVLAGNGGCVSLLGDHASFVDGKDARPLHESANAVAASEDEILLASAHDVFAYRGNAAPITMRGDVGVTALLRVPGFLVLGFKNGSIELAPESGPRPTFAFEGVPASAVVRLLAGPTGTLIAGFADGTLGIWQLENGSRLDVVHLHGAVQHLLDQDGKLYAATDLGDHAIVDLTTFQRSYCDLLADVWQSVPVLWEGGLPVLRDIPADHPCRRASAPSR